MSGLTDAIDGICGLVSSERRAARVAGELGEVVHTQPNALRVRPRGEHFRDAYVVHGDDGDVSYVELSLRQPASLDVLSAAFGEYDEPPRVHWDSPRRLFFDAPRAACSVLVDLEDDSVSTVIVRHDG